MSRMSTVCGLSGLLALLIISNVASAGSITVHTTTPVVTVHPAVTPKVDFKPIYAGKHIPVATMTVRKVGSGATPYDDKQKSGNSNMFLKLDGIEGESKDDNHKSE